MTRSEGGDARRMDVQGWATFCVISRERGVEKPRLLRLDPEPHSNPTTIEKYQLDLGSEVTAIFLQMIRSRRFSPRTC
jgi:hypothetical protein